MKIISISQLEKTALDLFVIQALGYPIHNKNGQILIEKDGLLHPLSAFNFHENWELSGPILTQEVIQLSTSDGKGFFIGEEIHGLRWLARYKDGFNEIGRTPIEAFLRAFIVKKLNLGSTVEVKE